VKELAADAKKVNNSFRLIWIGCGTEDRLYRANLVISEFFSQRGIKHTWRSTGGGHTWQVWRRYLHEVSPMLFPARAS
jgi:enterochelin esterase-like enzyme